MTELRLQPLCYKCYTEFVTPRVYINLYRMAQKGVHKPLELLSLLLCYSQTDENEATRLSNGYFDT